MLLLLLLLRSHHNKFLICLTSRSFRATECWMWALSYRHYIILSRSISCCFFFFFFILFSHSFVWSFEKYFSNAREQHFDADVVCLPILIFFVHTNLQAQIFGTAEHTNVVYAYILRNLRCSIDSHEEFISLTFFSFSLSLSLFPFIPHCAATPQM